MPTLALDPLDLARLESMSVRARVIVEGAFAGLHHNPHAGTSIEFAEHKEYAPGDDIRHIDWKAVGRIDRYYLKRFEDETEMRTFLLLDASASMGYGRKGPTKLAYATYLAAALATCWRSRAIRRGCCCSTTRRASTCRRARAAGTSAICCSRSTPSTRPGGPSPGARWPTSASWPIAAA